ERFKYSNVGYALLALIAEEAAGEPFGDFVRREIIDPLGLADTGTDFEPARADDYAIGYSSLAYADTRAPIESFVSAAMAGAGGFYSTATDLTAYFSAHFVGTDQLLGDGSKREMQRSLWETEGGARYGLGLTVDTVGSRTVFGHGGGWPGHITRSVASPADAPGLSRFTNANDGPAEAPPVAALHILDPPGARPRPADGPDLERFAGRYANLWGVIDIAVLGGRLYQLAPGQIDPTEGAVELAYEDETTLRVVDGAYGSYGEPMRFELAADGRIVRIHGGMSHVPLADWVATREPTLQA